MMDRRASDKSDEDSDEELSGPVLLDSSIEELINELSLEDSWSASAVLHKEDGEPSSKKSPLERQPPSEVLAAIFSKMAHKVQLEHVYIDDEGIPYEGAVGNTEPEVDLSEKLPRVKIPEIADYYINDAYACGPPRNREFIKSQEFEMALLEALSKATMLPGRESQNEEQQWQRSRGDHSSKYQNDRMPPLQDPTLLASSLLFDSLFEDQAVQLLLDHQLSISREHKELDEEFSPSAFPLLLNSLFKQEGYELPFEKISSTVEECNESLFDHDILSGSDLNRVQTPRLGYTNESTGDSIGIDSDPPPAEPSSSSSSRLSDEKSSDKCTPYEETLRNELLRWLLTSLFFVVLSAVLAACHLLLEY